MNKISKVSKQDNVYLKQKIGMMQDVLKDNILLELFDDPDFICELIFDVEKKKKDYSNFLSFIVIQNDKTDDGLFKCFFDGISQLLFNKIKTNMCEDMVLHNICDQIVDANKWLCMRCFIVELNMLSDDGLLIGEDKRNKYLYFIEHYLCSDEYIKKFWEKYPIIRDVLSVRLCHTIDYINLIFERIIHDKKEIIQHLCNGNDFEKVIDVKINLSDEHMLGESVVRIKLDNSYIVYYKPHTLDNAVYYNYIASKLSEMTGIETYFIKRISKKNYGWEQNVEFKSCESKADVSHFFTSLGVHLFMAYVLNLSDLHIENIIAHGKYPVIIDFEIMPDYKTNFCIRFEKLDDYLKDSVFNTGMLPLATENALKASLSGLGSNSKNISDFKLPVVKNRGTVDMCIAYEHAVIKPKENIPMLYGIKQNYENYLKDIIAGFRYAYKAVLNNKNVIYEEIMRSTWLSGVKSRYLLRSTQEYFMYQKSSNFPFLMQDSEKRFIMLYSMSRNFIVNDAYKRKILKYEIESVYWGIYPIYYANERDLIMGNGDIIKGYFDKNAKEMMYQRFNKLSNIDLNFQCKVMEINFMEALKLISPYATVSGCLEEGGCLLKNIANCIIDNMMETKQDIGWINVSYVGNGVSYPKFTDMYLYNGVSGIAIFLKALSMIYKENKYIYIAEKLINKLFEHTKLLGNMDENEMKQKNTCFGLFTGEMSISYTYLMLYRTTKEKKYLKYARYHADIVMNYICAKNGCAETMYIKNPDYIEGKAGIGILFVELFKELHYLEYLDCAKLLAEQLVEEAIDIRNKGIGWLIDGQKNPLAGLAHGNSGIVLFFAKLWTVTKNDSYVEIIRKAIRYEDSLYDEKIMNWCDIRHYEHRTENRDMVAWCHGSGGILAVRAFLHKELKLDLDWGKYQQAFEKLCNSKTESMCMCHGTLGNELLIKYIKNNAGDMLKGDKDEKRMMKLSWEDGINTGFMLGLSGIGYGLLKSDISDLPEVLIC